MERNKMKTDKHFSELYLIERKPYDNWYYLSNEPVFYYRITAEQELAKRKKEYPNTKFRIALYSRKKFFKG